MSSERGSKHIYVYNHRLYYYCYHFEGHRDNKNWKKWRQNSLNKDTRQAEDISALQISILAHKIDHDALQSKNNEKLTTFFIWTLQFTILKLHKML